jgi:hypothetical protein
MDWCKVQVEKSGYNSENYLPPVFHIPQINHQEINGFTVKDQIYESNVSILSVIYTSILENRRKANQTLTYSMQFYICICMNLIQIDVHTPYIYI